MADTDRIAAAAELLASAERIACLTGAGVSAESGVATFRDAQTGLWSRLDPRQLASQEGFAAEPGLVWRWYMARLEQVTETAPNPGHVALAEIEKRADVFSLITQNVDDLHERGGSRAVIHLHGTIARFRCNVCLRPHQLEPDERTADEPPICRHCGGNVRPAVVWFGEMLPEDALRRAWDAAAACDVMLVVGTSGVVYPAARLPDMARQNGARIIDVNPDPSPISRYADLYLRGASGEVLPQVAAALNTTRSES